MAKIKFKLYHYGHQIGVRLMAYVLECLIYYRIMGNSFRCMVKKMNVVYKTPTTCHIIL